MSAIDDQLGVTLSHHFRWEERWEGKTDVVGKAKAECESERGDERKRTEKPLSPLKLKTLEPGRHADGNGLYLDVQESGSRSWICGKRLRENEGRSVWAVGSTSGHGNNHRFSSLGYTV